MFLKCDENKSEVSALPGKHPSIRSVAHTPQTQTHILNQIKYKCKQTNSQLKDLSMNMYVKIYY